MTDAAEDTVQPAATVTDTLLVEQPKIDLSQGKPEGLPECVCIPSFS